MATDAAVVAPRFAARLARLAAPNIAGTLIQALVSIVEAWRLGGLGGTALAGVALVFPLFMLASMLSAGAIGGAVSGATARAVGAGDGARAEAVLRCALVIAIAGGLVMGLLLLAGGPWFYAMLGGDGAVLAAALAYSDVLMSGLVAVWLFNMLAAVLRGSGDMIAPLVAIVVVTIVHFAAGAWLVPAFGMAGAAGSIVAAYAVGLLFLLARLARPSAPIRLRRGRMPGAVAGPLLKYGLLAGSQSFMTIGLSLITTALVGRLGTAWLAGYGIGVRLELLMVPVIFGFGGALIALVGTSAGAGRRAEAIAFAWKGAAVTAVVVGAIGLGFSVAPWLWTGLYTDSPAIADACALYLAIVGPCYAFFALGLCLYFTSQALQTLALPVSGAALRLALVAAGGTAAFALDAAKPEVLFAVVAGAMAVYGLFVAGALRLGPWAPGRPAPAGQPA